MNRFPFVCVVLIVASSVSAQVMRGPSTWSNPVSAGQAASISNFLASPAASAVGFSGLVAGLRGSLNEAGSPALAPLADALAAQGVAPGEVPTAAQFEQALVDASRAVQKGVRSLLEALTPEEAAAWEARAERLSSYASAYGLYMAAHDLSDLRIKIDMSKSEAAYYRGQAAGASAKRDADALKQGRDAQDVPASAPAPETGLSRATERDASAQQPAPPAPASPAPVTEPAKGFNWFNVGLYTGVVLIMGSFGWFMVQNWAALGALGIMGVAGLMAAVLAGAGKAAQHFKFTQVAGLLNATAVGMTPLFAYGLLSAFGKAPGDYHSYYTNIDLSWTFIEFATIAVAAATAFFARAKSSMVALPAAIAAWFLSMDLARAFTGGAFDWQSQAWFSVMSGVAMMAAGRFIDRITKVDYPFWINLAGLLAFTGGMFMLPSNGELGRFIFAAVHAGLVGVGLYFNRATYAVFGGAMVFGYVGYLFSKFVAVLAFPIAAGVTGLAVIGLTILLYVKMPAIKAWLRMRFPQQDRV